MEIEKLRVENIIEIKQISGLLQTRPELLTIFKMLCRSANVSINGEDRSKKNIIDDDTDEEIDIKLESDSDSEGEDEVNSNL
tara:strand:- start:1487 stop:1732 length:246 start_codon:yes stop_codon:yes gene_type:complete